LVNRSFLTVFGDTLVCFAIVPLTREATPNASLTLVTGAFVVEAFAHQAFAFRRDVTVGRANIPVQLNAAVISLTIGFM
jgi:hypothetical protein